MSDTFDCPQCGDRFLVNESQIRHCPGCAHPVGGKPPWRSDPPTEPGFWWWRGMPNQPEIVVEVLGEPPIRVYRHGREEILSPGMIGGQWAGPLVPPPG